MATKYLKYGQCDWGTEFFFLIYCFKSSQRASSYELNPIARPCTTHNTVSSALQLFDNCFLKKSIKFPLHQSVTPNSLLAYSSVQSPLPTFYGHYPFDFLVPKKHIGGFAYNSHWRDLNAHKHTVYSKPLEGELWVCQHWHIGEEAVSTSPPHSQGLVCQSLHFKVHTYAF